MSWKMNKEMKVFLLKLIAYIVCWESLYILLLKPHRLLDDPLTRLLTISVTACLNFFLKLTPAATWRSDPFNADACIVQQHGRTILTVFDDCNGLDLFVIYLAFIVLLPYPAKRKLVFSFWGIAAIFLGNIIRCASLYWIYVHHKSVYEFNHHYVFTVMMYLIIFYGWVLFTKKPRLVDEVS